jgi:tetratricopeptide (TPR) repeat protein
MVAVIAANADIAEEVELGRTLLVQGHLDTAQRVLVKVCQAQPEHAEAFRVLALVLAKRGDDKRSQTLSDYANELDSQRTNEIPTSIDDPPSDAETRRNRLVPQMIPRSKEPQPVARQEPMAPVAPISLPQPVQAPPAGLPVMTLPRPSPIGPPKRRRVWAFLAMFLGMGVAAAAVVGYQMYGRGKSARPSPREELDRALVSGTLEILMRARDVAQLALENGTPEPDSLVRLGLVNALLASDYAVDAKKDAESALKRALGGPDVSKERMALDATARALLALVDGNRAMAKEQVETAMSVAGGDVPAFALLASGRVRALAGDAAGAARDLDRAMGASPDLAPVVVDWAASQLDGGNPVTARRALAALLEKNPENSRARLYFAETERALGEPDWVKNIEHACRSDVKISRNIRAACAVESALQARLDGDRTGALRKAKAVSQTTEDPFLLGQISLLLATLGETDAADDVLARARKAADGSIPAIKWADLAIRLSRGENAQTIPLVEHPAGPERDLVALRLAYARGGAEGLAAALKGLPPGILDIDWDIRAFSVLAGENGPTKPELTALEKRGDKGNPVVSYALGLLASRDKDYKLAVRRLEKALSLHGDACLAATLYLTAVGHAGRGVQANKSALRGVHNHNAKCPLGEL